MLRRGAGGCCRRCAWAESLCAARSPAPSCSPRTCTRGRRRPPEGRCRAGARHRLDVHAGGAAPTGTRVGVGRRGTNAGRSCDQADGTAQAGRARATRYEVVSLQICFVLFSRSRLARADRVCGRPARSPQPALGARVSLRPASAQAVVPRQQARPREQPRGRASAVGLDGEAAGAPDRPLQLSAWDVSKWVWQARQGHETMSRGSSRELSDASTDLSLRRDGAADRAQSRTQAARARLDGCMTLPLRLVDRWLHPPPGFRPRRRDDAASATGWWGFATNLVGSNVATR